MKSTNSYNPSIRKAVYEKPHIDITQLLNTDIIATSVNGDENQGEWDSQATKEIY